MAKFEVLEQEGTYWVKVTLRDETVRAEAGALSYLKGKITVHAPIPSLNGVVKSVLADESIVRPTYTGTGEVHLESSLGGFHTIEVKGEAWILESGSYWASDGAIEVSTVRERAWTAFWTGEGFIQFQTKVSGSGKVVVRTDGPVEEIKIRGGRYLAEGKIVVGRTGGISYTFQRPTGGYLGYLVSGESYLRCYEGSGRLLVCSTPYWRLRFQNLTRQP
jgi:uncharacterized protein (AIM24 family)